MIIKKTNHSGKEIVLVGVLKNRRDQEILLKEHWYRIPVSFLPKRKFSYLAFYQPAGFGKDGKKIEYFAQIADRKDCKRFELIPDEPDHPHAADDYIKFSLDEIIKLTKPIKNIIPRRVTFGFTTLNQLLKAKNILELYGVPATEQIILSALVRQGIPVVSQYPIGYSSGRFRIDLVIACRNGWLAIECDNEKAHQTSHQLKKDRRKDFILGYHGWRIIRLREKDILNHFDRSMARLQMAIASIGGLA